MLAMVRRVSGIDLMLLYGETRSWQMHVSSLALLEPSTAPASFGSDAVRDTLEARMPAAPQCHILVREVARGFDRPVLIEQDDLALERHIHQIALPPPGGPRELGMFAGRLVARPLERSGPLWEAWIIDGLDDGRIAVLTKVHHALVDGVSGAALAATVLDLEPASPDSGPRHHGSNGSQAVPTGMASVAGGMRHTLLTAVRIARCAVDLSRQAAVAGRHLAQGSAAGMPFVAARSSVNGRLTPRRSLAYRSIPIADVTTVKRAYGVTVNEVVLALVSGALRSWLQSRGELPRRSLVAEIPLSTRVPGAEHQVGTKVANAFVSLATDLEHPVARLLAIHRSSTDAKSLQQELRARKHIDITDVPPPAVLGAALRAFAGSGLEARIPPIYSVIVSTIPGPAVDLYLAGAKLSALYPMGPLLLGSGLNVTALSLGDRIDFGLAACPDIVADPWDIADRIPTALEELVATC
jgi:WS/DGAT/MGAT family acyltransferase